MKPLTTALIIGGGILLLGVTARTAASVQSLRFGLADADFQCDGILCTSPKITLSIRIQNPSGIAYTIRSMAGDVYLNDVFVGNAAGFQPLEIKAYAESIYNIDLRINAAAVLSSLRDFFTGGLKGVIDFRGTATAGSIPVPVNVQYRIV